jgi:hypothetical protein
MSVADVAREPRAVAKDSSGFPRDHIDAELGDPKSTRAWCRGTAPTRAGHDARNMLFRKMHATVSFENDKFWMDELAHDVDVDGTCFG